MKNNFKKAYLAGALTHSGESDRNLYEELASICRSLGIETYVPHLWGTDPLANPEILPEEIWEITNRQVNSLDFLIAYVGKPSLGTGAELEIARIANLPIILWWFKGEKVSRMALGNPAVISRLEISDISEFREKLYNIINSKTG